IKLFAVLLLSLLFVGCENNNDIDNEIEKEKEKVPEIPQGIDLNKYAFGIPLEDVDGIGNRLKFSLSFWVNAKEFNHLTEGTTLFSIRDVKSTFPDNDYGWICANIGPGRFNKNSEGLSISIDNMYSNPSLAFPFVQYDFTETQWYNFTFVFDYTNKREVKAYINGDLIYETPGQATYDDSFDDKMVLLIGGFAQNRAPLNACIDKVQIYTKALSESEVQESMVAPLLQDPSLCAYWDFEKNSNIDSDGFMHSDNNTGVKATMYEIETHTVVDTDRNKEYVYSAGLQVRPFTFAMGK
ncbi:MAG: LamG domain-containing protein, partial [Bacteroidales bacterium]|nr:LamG domain-containing protein [Bacteroidales bacterium]